MKQASPALLSFVQNATQYVAVDFYTITLNGGGVVRWNSCASPITTKINGSTNTWNAGPPIEDGGVQSVGGSGANTVDVTILAGDGRFTVGGVDVLEWIDGLALSGAWIRIDRGFAASWSQMLTTGPVGTFCRFMGLLPEIKEFGLLQAVITWKSPRALLGQQHPFEMYQTPCMRVFGDAGCGVNRAALSVTGEVAGGSPTDLGFATNLTQADGYFALGTITFTSGVNEGLARSVKLFANASGAVTVSSPFPAAPSVGDTFSIAPGCTKAQSSTNPNGCVQWQGSVEAMRERFQATPFVPPPYTGLPT